MTVFVRHVIFTTRPVMGKNMVQEYGHLSHIFMHVVKNWKHRLVLVIQYQLIIYIIIGVNLIV